MLITHEVQLVNEIAGILTKPTTQTFPAVLLLHGFASDKNEVGDMYQNLALKLAKNNIASLRIDFRGWGESTGKMSDTTIDGQINDASVALDFLEKEASLKQNKLGLVGFSLGGAIAMILAANNPDRVSAIAVWSSVGRLENDFRESLGDHVFDIAKKHGSVEVDLGWRRVEL
jgi:pimeloyl-ACP methyl ester carboxylesterase